MYYKAAILSSPDLVPYSLLTDGERRLRSQEQRDATL